MGMFLPPAIYVSGFPGLMYLFSCQSWSLTGRCYFPWYSPVIHCSFSGRLFRMRSPQKGQGHTPTDCEPRGFGLRSIIWADLRIHRFVHIHFGDGTALKFFWGIIDAWGSWKLSNGRVVEDQGQPRTRWVIPISLTPISENISRFKRQGPY